MFPEPEESNGAVNRGVTLCTHENPHAGRAKKAVAPDVPAGLVQHPPARRRQAYNIRPLCPGDEAH